MDVLARDVTLAALSSSLSGLEQRQALLAQNIANANTPGYKRRDSDFASVLAQTLSRQAGGGAAAGGRQRQVREILGSVAHEVVEEDLFYRSDMGGVDIDREMALQAETSLKFAALAQLTQKRIAQYRLVIRDGRM